MALAIPAYNEADGIAEFLLELDEVLRNRSSSVDAFIVDDCSTDDMCNVIRNLSPELVMTLHLDSMSENSGHGPTVAQAYRQALGSGAGLILQVDGDGQFLGEDVALLFEAIDRGADVATGVRTTRADPWFRKVLSRALRLYIRASAGVWSSDPNCPFRLYRREALSRLLPDLPERPLVPTVYLTVLERQTNLKIVEVPVRHRQRRGVSSQGTMWGRARQRRILVPKRLVKFVWAALFEYRRFVQVRRSYGERHGTRG